MRSFPVGTLPSQRLIFIKQIYRRIDCYTREKDEGREASLIEIETQEIEHAEDSDERDRYYEYDGKGLTKRVEQD